MKKVVNIKLSVILVILQALIGTVEITAAETCGDWWKDETRIGRLKPWYNIYFSPLNNNDTLGKKVEADEEGSVTHLLENFSNENIKNFLNSDVGKSITWLEQPEFQKFLISIFSFRLDRTHLSAKYFACKKLPRTSDNVTAISMLKETYCELRDKEDFWSRGETFK